MSFLLDVNVLVALGWLGHSHNYRVRKWMACELGKRTSFATTPITELCFIRISTQISDPKVSVAEAAVRLEEITGQLRHFHTFLTDDLSSRRNFPGWCTSPKHTTDAHLLALAEKHGLQLATLDTEIPGAFIIPE
jgi:predicted nucleic acid-binding protein